MRAEANLTAQINQLKEAQVKKEAEWELVQKEYEQNMQTLRAEVGKAGRRRKTAEEKADDAEKAATELKQKLKSEYLLYIVTLSIWYELC